MLATTADEQRAFMDQRNTILPLGQSERKCSPEAVLRSEGGGAGRGAAPGGGRAAPGVRGRCCHDAGRRRHRGAWGRGRWSAAPGGGGGEWRRRQRQAGEGPRPGMGCGVRESASATVGRWSAAARAVSAWAAPPNWQWAKSGLHVNFQAEAQETQHRTFLDTK
uniref:Uncharacterized protein n=1 Tax=Oryza brachyantha TaxID=4533 RepID=J3LKN8_ORYBR